MLVLDHHHNENIQNKPLVLHFVHIASGSIMGTTEWSLSSSYVTFKNLHTLVHFNPGFCINRNVCTAMSTFLIVNFQTDLCSDLKFMFNV